jgi:hypothetical protein
VQYVLLTYFVFLGLTAFTSKFVISKFRGEHPVSLILAMIILYLFGCVQLLGVGVKLVLACAAIGGIAGLWTLVRGGAERFSIARQAIELAVLFALALVLSWGSQYWVWDEFSHWGAEAEYLSLTNNLPTSKEVQVFPNYIPGISLLRYFGESLLHGSGVASAYFITWLLGLSTIYCVSNSESRTKWAITIITLFFAYLAFYQALTLTLLIDPLQSLLFLCALRFAYKNDRDSFTIALLAVIAVVLLKHVGIILAIFVCAYYVGMRMFADKLEIKAILPRSLGLLAATLLTYLSWEWYVATYDLTIKFEGMSVMLTGAGLLSNVSIGLHHVLGNLFPHSAFLPPAYPVEFLTPGIPLWMFICITAAAALVLTYNRSSSQKELALTFAFLLLTTVGYLLFLSYVAVASGWFNDHVSFSRYFIVTLFATFFLQYFVARDGLSILRCLLIAVIMIGAAYVSAPSLSSFFVQEKRPPVPLHEEYRLKAAPLLKYTTGTELIVYIDGKDASFGHFIFRLKTQPLRYLPYSRTWFMNQPTTDNAKNIDLFKRTLCQADYVYADSPPEDFWKRNGEAFDIVGGHVYKVVREDSKYCTATLLEK